MKNNLKGVISGNSRNVNKLESYRIDATEGRAVELAFSGNNVMVQVDVEVYTREYSMDHLIIGSPNENHSIGNGGIGIEYGPWNKVVDERTSGVFTQGGRQAVLDSLRGVENGIRFMVVGSGDSIVRTSDDALDVEESQKRALQLASDPNEITAMQTFSSYEIGDLTEAGIVDRDDRLMCRLLFDLEWSENTEYRVEITFSFESQTTGDAIITDLGLEAMAESVAQSETVVGINRAVIGTGDAMPDATDTDLDVRVDSKAVQRVMNTETISALTMWFEDEPAGHPHEFQEVGLEDNEGRLIWRTIFDPERKTSEIPIIFHAGLRII